MYKSTNYILAIGLLALTACGNTGVNTTPNTSSTSPSVNSSSGITQGNTSVTLAKFNQVTNGMTEGQVTAILGQPSAKDILNIGLGDTVTLSWKNSTGGFELVTVTFQNNKVTNKSQFNLR